MVEYSFKRNMPVTVKASTLKLADVREVYEQAVEKLVRDNGGFGKGWQEKVMYLLLDKIYPASPEGDFRGSNPYVATMLSSLGVPLISLQDLRNVYVANGNKSPFFGNYVETGWGIIPGKNPRNPEITSRLVTALKSKGIELCNGKHINFAQLELVPVGKAERPLEFTLNDSATSEAVVDLGNYKWDYGNNGNAGAFRAYLGGGSDWGVDYGDSEDSNENGRVVYLVAEGDARKKLVHTVKEEDIVAQKFVDFRKRV